MKHIDLFAGAGGLALGCHWAGFDPFIYVDNDKYCFKTLAANARKYHQGAIIENRDVRTLDWDDQQTEIALLSGGVPCQPWSNGGKHKGLEDERNLWPEFLRIMAGVRPKAVIAENVSGILRPRFSDYFEYIKRAMASPAVKRWTDEPWESHSQQLRYSGGRSSLHYDVHVLSLNAAMYGVPQERSRVILVAFRRDLGIDYHFGYGKRIQPSTLRDAIGTMSDPREPNGYLDHIYVPGAREYRGHTANELDRPAKTVKAGVHGMPGGEGIVRLDDGSIRYLTVRELARIQTFPDDYIFTGSRTQQIKQIGNAVPVYLAYHVAKSVYEHLEKP